MTDDGLPHIYDALHRSEWVAARALCRAELSIDPSCAAVHHALGLSLCGEGAYADALPHLERACQLDVQTTRWARDAGLLNAKLGRWRTALATWRPVVANLDEETLTIFLVAAVEGVCAGVALDWLHDRSLSFPDTSSFLRAYGAALAAASRYAEAETVLSRGLALDETAGLHGALADLYDQTARADLALQHRAAQARLEPQSAIARLRFALACSERGRWVESRAARAEAEQLGLARAEDRSASLLMSLAEPDESAATILAAARAAFADQKATGAAHQVHTPSSRASRRLRVGYLSGEFRATPAYYFCRSFLERHDRSAIEVFLYSCSRRCDDVTRAYAEWGEHWRDVADLNDAELVRRLRADDLDVLVELSGHLPDNRLRALCDRVAPVQSTYPNNSATTGCPGIDYFLTDRWASPPGSEHEYSERLYRLPSGHLMFHPPDDGPAVAPLPARATGRPTFGMFQRLAKFNAGVWDAVAAILARVPRSALFLQCGDIALDCTESPTSQLLRGCLSDRGIDPNRLLLSGPRSYIDHLHAVGGVDIALDTFPYGGQTTTCHALWMGVPVVTRRSDSHVGRLSGALLTRAHHAEWVASSSTAYVETAVSLASDLSALGRIRHRLRQDVVDSGLTDGPTLARELEAAYVSLFDTSFCRCL